MTEPADSIPPDRERTDPSPPPDADPHVAAILERLGGIEAAVRASHLLLDTKTDAIVDALNVKIGAISTVLGSMNDKQAEQGRQLTWLKRAAMDLAETLDKSLRDQAAFQDHVFQQIDRTSLRPDDEHNGNGKTGTNGE